MWEFKCFVLPSTFFYIFKSKAGELAFCFLLSSKSLEDYNYHLKICCLIFSYREFWRLLHIFLGVILDSKLSFPQFRLFASCLFYMVKSKQNSHAFQAGIWRKLITGENKQTNKLITWVEHQWMCKSTHFLKVNEKRPCMIQGPPWSWKVWTKNWKWVQFTNHK